jgi:hypothetical protein
MLPIMKPFLLFVFLFLAELQPCLAQLETRLETQLETRLETQLETHAQVDLPVGSPLAPQYKILTLGQQGLLLVMEVRQGSLLGQRSVRLAKFGADLRLDWERVSQGDLADFAYLHHLADGQVHFFYPISERLVGLTSIGLASGEIMPLRCRLPVALKVSHFAAHQGRYLIGGRHGDHPVVVSYEPEHEICKVLPGLHRHRATLRQIDLSATDGTISLVMTSQVADGETIDCLQYNHDGQLTNQVRAQADQGRHFLSFHVHQLASGKPELVGFYRAKDRAQPGGFYRLPLQPGGRLGFQPLAKPGLGTQAQALVRAWGQPGVGTRLLVEHYTPGYEALNQAVPANLLASHDLAAQNALTYLLAQRKPVNTRERPTAGPDYYRFASMDAYLLDAAGQLIKEFTLVGDNAVASQPEPQLRWVLAGATTVAFYVKNQDVFYVQHTERASIPGKAPLPGAGRARVVQWYGAYFLQHELVDAGSGKSIRLQKMSFGVGEEPTQITPGGGN